MCKKSKNGIVKKKRKYQLPKCPTLWRVVPRDSCEIYRERLKRRIEESCSERGDSEIKDEKKKRKFKTGKNNVRKTGRYTRRRRYRSESITTVCSSFSCSSGNTMDLSDVLEMDTD